MYNLCSYSSGSCLPFVKTSVSQFWSLSTTALSWRKTVLFLCKFAQFMVLAPLTLISINTIFKSTIFNVTRQRRNTFSKPMAPFVCLFVCLCINYGGLNNISVKSSFPYMCLVPPGNNLVVPITLLNSILN